MDYLVLKLVSGEIVVGLSNNMGEDFVQLACPYEVVKEVMRDEDNIVTKTMLRPYCPFTDEETVVFQLSHLIYVLPLKEDLIKVYKDLVETTEEVNNEVPPEDSLSFLVEASSTVQ